MPRPKLKYHLRLCKHCKNWYNSTSKVGRCCERCRQKHYDKIKGKDTTNK